MSKYKKGIILAGGLGSRLYPVTNITNKHLLPIFDKPMIYYPLTTLMLSGIRDILIITNAHDVAMFQDILSNSHQWGVNISYEVQDQPSGIAEAFIIGENFINDQNVVLILGDNFFHGQGLSDILEQGTHNLDNATVFAMPVTDPERFGIVTLDKHGNPISIEEKPQEPISNLAISGLYFYDSNVVEYAKSLKPSSRGELEISDINRIYLDHGKLDVKIWGRGVVWFDMGLPSAILKAANYVDIIQSQQSLGIAFPEEVAWRLGYINNEKMDNIISQLNRCEYRQYLERIFYWKHY